MQWSDIVKMCSSVVRTEEPFATFMAADADFKASKKDVGGFVCAFLQNGSRSKNAVLHKQIAAFDCDYTQPGFIDRIKQLPCASVWYTTHSHSPGAPRYRILIPLDRPVLPIEYEPIARWLANWIGIDNVDRTSYDLNRLMFKPSVSADGVFEWGETHGAWASADGILSTYTNWQDASSWPIGANESVQINADIAQLGDPRLKKGIIGAFCKVFTVKDVIERFLHGFYDPSDNPDRYTYRYGSTAKGLIVYTTEDWEHSWSHHGTDPTAGSACNAFDLVWTHLFGASQENPMQKMGDRPSFKACSEWMRSLPEIRQALLSERYVSAQEEFTSFQAEPTGVIGAPAVSQPQAVLAAPAYNAPLSPVQSAVLQTAVAAVDPYNVVTSGEPLAGGGLGVAPIEPYMQDKYNETNWLGGLTLDKQGKIDGTIDNIVHVLSYDPKLKGVFALDDFSKRGVILKTPVWWREGRTPIHNDTDDFYLEQYLEFTYGISSPTKVLKALAIAADKAAFHPVRNYLNSLSWDGTPRIETLFNLFLGAEDSEYTRQISRKWFTAAVSRVFKPGCKFDNMIIFVGTEGKGKSTLVDKLGSPWFSDTPVDLRNKKESMEELQGVWIMEWGELTSFRTASVEQVKNFVGKRIDRFRAPYGRRVDDYPRQCIFMGSTNLMEFLNDPDGNRRFWPVLIEAVPIRFSVHDDFTPEIKNQIWAEAMVMFRAGEPLTLSKEMELYAKSIQKMHTESDDRLGLIDDYLNRMLPANWYQMDEGARLTWLINYVPGKPMPGDRPREKVCAAEIWIEVFGGSKQTMTKLNTRFIHNYLRSLKTWVPVKNTANFGYIGEQRGYFNPNIGINFSK